MNIALALVLAAGVHAAPTLPRDLSFLPALGLSPAAVVPVADAPGRAEPAAGEAPPPMPIPMPALTAIITPQLWNRLPAVTDPVVLARLRIQMPWLNTAGLKELPAADAEALLAEAVANGRTVLDFFTDPGLRGGYAYYLSGDTVRRVAQTFDIPIIFHISGNEIGGQPVAMTDLVMGQGHVDILYDRDNFTYETRWFPDRKYISRARIGQTILGDGDLRVEGLSVSAMVAAGITRFTKLNPDEARVEISLAGVSYWQVRRGAPLRRSGP